jgi:protein disulfide-isomerase-like protein
MFEDMRRNPLMIVLACALIIIIIIAVFTPRNHRLTAGLRLGGHVGSLRGEFNVETFANSVKPSLVLFYAPWCGHCKKMMPTWDLLTKSNTSGVDIVKVNCDENKDLAKKHSIQGFPTVKFLPQGVLNTLPDAAQEYNGARTLGALKSHLKSLM